MLDLASGWVLLFCSRPDLVPIVLAEAGMKIRDATTDDAAGIRNLYQKAFDNSEASMVSDLAVNLLNEKHSARIISLVAVDDDEIIGHAAFSPVYYASTNEMLGYILAPLAVSPESQGKRIGTALVRCGLDIIANSDVFIVFVYGDPQYYTRFGFEVGLARRFIPPYTLQFPEGWLALKLHAAGYRGGGAIACVDSLDIPGLW